MNDFFGHGTASSATIVSKGKMEYDIYNDTNKSTILGIAPGCKYTTSKVVVVW